MAKSADLIAVGQIVKPFGIQGDVRVRSLTDVPGRLTTLKAATLVAPSGREVATTVRSVREETGGFFIMGFEAFSTPEQAAAFRGGFIKISREQSPPLPAGQYYESDLIGLQVREESGTVLGMLEEILETGSNHVFVVRQGTREFLIPSTKEAVVSVDVQAGVMIVRRLEGLWEDDVAV
jgi:16S rRNA processing protein RimM